MKIEKLSLSKLKLTLYHEDLLLWGFTPDSLAENSPHVEELFYMLLSKAEAETGFDFDSVPVFIEAMLTEDNAVELLITKMDAPQKGKTKYKVKNLKKSPIVQNSAFMFRFSDFEGLCELARIWDNNFYTEIYEENGQYFLFVQALSKESVAQTRLVIAEYADALENPLVLRSRLAEHANLIAKGNALEIIKKFFN